MLNFCEMPRITLKIASTPLFSAAAVHHAVFGLQEGSRNCFLIFSCFYYGPVSYFLCNTGRISVNFKVLTGWLNPYSFLGITDLKVSWLSV